MSGRTRRRSSRRSPDDRRANANSSDRRRGRRACGGALATAAASLSVVRSPSSSSGASRRCADPTARPPAPAAASARAARRVAASVDRRRRSRVSTSRVGARTPFARRGLRLAVALRRCLPCGVTIRSRRARRPRRAPRARRARLRRSATLGLLVHRLDVEPVAVPRAERRQAGPLGRLAERDELLLEDGRVDVGEQRRHDELPPLRDDPQDRVAERVHDRRRDRPARCTGSTRRPMPALKKNARIGSVCREELRRGLERRAEDRAGDRSDAADHGEHEHVDARLGVNASWPTARWWCANSTPATPHMNPDSANAASFVRIDVDAERLQLDLVLAQPDHHAAGPAPAQRRRRARSPRRGRPGRGSTCSARPRSR